MSCLIEEVEITRSSIDGHYDSLEIQFDDGYDGCSVDRSYATTNNEDVAIVELSDEFVRFLQLLQFQTSISLEQLRLKIIQGFCQLRANHFSGNRHLSMNISLIPEVQPEPHFSCKMNQNENDTTHSSGGNEFSQSEVQQKLAIYEKENKVMKLFKENTCSVCLSSYKEILDDNHHIVVPSCGHPLCCECADNILRSTKKECPLCRGNFTADSFNRMKFNADLEIVAQDRKLFF